MKVPAGLLSPYAGLQVAAFLLLAQPFLCVQYICYFSSFYKDTSLTTSLNFNYLSQFLSLK